MLKCARKFAPLDAEVNQELQAEDHDAMFFSSMDNQYTRVLMYMSNIEEKAKELMLLHNEHSERYRARVLRFERCQTVLATGLSAVLMIGVEGKMACQWQRF